MSARAGAESGAASSPEQACAGPQLQRTLAPAEWACEACVRRSWLLAALAPSLDYVALDRDRMMALLALEADQLIRELGGRRRAQLQYSYERLQASEVPRGRGVGALCVHCDSYPRALSFSAAPRMLYLAGGQGRTKALAVAPAVAIVGTAHATDYGVQTASSLARGLAISGVSIVCACARGIGLAVLSGATEIGGNVVCVMPGGIDVSCPAALRSPLRRALVRGCAVAELPSGVRARRWGAPASERTIAGLAALILVVEAEDNRRSLRAAAIASSLGRALAAVPGRVTTLQASGPNALLAAGASLVRDTADVIALLGEAAPTRPLPGGRRPSELSPRLRTVLEGVGAGRDTPEKLARSGHRLQEALLALSELELMGLLARGDGGRYVPRNGVDGVPEVCRGEL
jgi:DNA processing protein